MAAAEGMVEAKKYWTGMGRVFFPAEEVAGQLSFFMGGDTEEVTSPGLGSQLTISHCNLSSARNSCINSMQFTVILKLTRSSATAWEKSYAAAPAAQHRSLPKSAPVPTAGEGAW